VLKSFQKSVTVYQSTRRDIPEDFSVDEVSLLTTAFLWRSSLAVGLTNKGHTSAYTSISCVPLADLRYPFLINPGPYCHISDLVSFHCHYFIELFVMTKFCTVAPHICVSSVWNSLNTILLASGILRWLLFWGKFVHPCL